MVCNLKKLAKCFHVHIVYFGEITKNFCYECYIVLLHSSSVKLLNIFLKVL